MRAPMAVPPLMWGVFLLAAGFGLACAAVYGWRALPWWRFRRDWRQEADLRLVRKLHGMRETVEAPLRPVRGRLAFGATKVLPLPRKRA